MDKASREWLDEVSQHDVLVLWCADNCTHWAVDQGQYEWDHVEFVFEDGPTFRWNTDEWCHGIEEPAKYMIASLQAQNAALTEERDAWRTAAGDVAGMSVRAHEQLNRSIEDNAALRRGAGVKATGVTLDMRGRVCARTGVEYLGSAWEMEDDTWRALANVNGSLCLVEVTITMEATA